MIEKDPLVIECDKRIVAMGLKRMARHNRLQTEMAECHRKIRAIKKQARLEISKQQTRIAIIIRTLAHRTTEERRAKARRRSRVQRLRFQTYRKAQVQARAAAAKALRAYYQP